MTIQEIANAIGTDTSDTGTISCISTDSREVPVGCLFIALSGERFNGHDYVRAALQAGAAYAIVHEHRDYGSDRILYVKDTERALMAIGRAYRAKFQIHCVGITGSVGKTTTKDMVAEVVEAGFKTLKTQGNLNNEIGLPKTLLNLDPSYQAAVIEMGMQGMGEIAALAEVAQPQLGVITNIGVSHIEQLVSRENILKAKLELADALPDGAPLLLCGDNDLLQTVEIPRLKVLFYGIENEQCEIRAQEIHESSTETAFTLVYDGSCYHTVIPCIGRHNVLNALAAFGVGRALGIDAPKCIAALRNYVPSGMRQKIVPYNGYTVVEDCYNASPDSMKAALKTLAAYPCKGRRIAVLADMLELGTISQQAHIEIGRFAAENGIELLLAYGDMARYYSQGAAQGKTEAAHFNDKSTLLAVLLKQLHAGDVVWFKGSHGMHLEEILQGLYEERQSK
ncbi:UDP-N-acetylmuramoyl-tripeptide--D-alanyl-D-alanine ligase [Oscillospiraceae bacterium PP1C4]